MILFSLLYLIYPQLVPSISGSTLYISGDEAISKSFIQSTGNFQGYTQIIIHEGITQILKEAFHSCQQLQYIELPSSISLLEKSLFMYCGNLAEIKVAQNSTFLKSSQGALYSNNFDVLYRCPSAVSTFSIPNTVLTLKESCFHMCRFNKIIIPSSVNYIESNCFTDIKILDLVIEFQKGSSITKLLGFFTAYSYINQIEIPKSVTHINNNAFSYTPYLTKVSFEENSDLTYLGGSITTPTIEVFDLPSKLQTISKLCFGQTTALKQIHIPSTVTSIAIDAFTGCSSLETITCDTNSYYFAEDNVLYNAARTQIIVCSVKKEHLKIGSNVKEIGPTVLQLCGSLVDVWIEDPDNNAFAIDGNVIYKGSQAFAAIGGAQSIEFRADCTKICDYACQSLQKLGEVTFKGTSVDFVGYRAFFMSSITKITFRSINLEISMEAFGYCSNLSQCIFESSVQIDKINSFTFWYSGLTSFTLPDSVEVIGEQPFRQCYKLTSFIINPTSKLTRMETSVFYISTALQSIYIPPKLTLIPEYCFWNCSSFSSIEFADGSEVADLGVYCFMNTNLRRIKLPKSLKTVNSYAFMNCFLLETVEFHSESQLNLAGGSIFTSCTNLKTVILPPSLQTINPFIFYDCTKLDDIKLEGNTYLKNVGGLIYKSNLETLVYCPGGIKQAEVLASVNIVMDNAFYGAKSLVDIDFLTGCSFTEIKAKTFYECISLTSIQIPPKVSNIMDEAFYSCISLQNVIFGDKSEIKEFGQGTFYGCTDLTKIVFEGNNNLRKIGSQAFKGCKKLNDGAFIQFASEIGSSAFEGCISLPNVIIKTNTISANTFLGCESLQTVSLPAAVSIGSSAFKNCINLKSIELLKVQTVGQSAFESCSALKSVTFGDLQQLNSGAFLNSGLEGLVIIPAGVSSIGSQCFIGTRVSRVEFCGRTDPAADASKGADILPEQTAVLVSNIYESRIFCGRKAHHGLASDCSAFEGTDNDFPSQLHELFLIASGLFDDIE